MTSQVYSFLNSTLSFVEGYADKASLLVDQVKQSDNQLVQQLVTLLSHPTLVSAYNTTTSFLLKNLPYLISFFGLIIHLLISQLTHKRTQRQNQSRALQYKADMTDYGLGTLARNAVEGLTGNGGSKEGEGFGQVEVQWGREKIRVPLPPPQSPLSTLKAALYNITGVPPSHQKLIYSGAILKDDLAPLTSYNLIDESSLPSPDSSDDTPSEGKSSSSKSFWDSWSFTGRNSSQQQKKLKKLIMLGSKDVSATVDDRLSSRKDLQELSKASAAGGGGVVEEKKVESEEVIQKKIKQISTEKLAELEPQVTQVEGWITQKKSEPPIEGEEKKAGPPPRILLYLSEILLQGLLKLDSIEIPSGYEDARKERKEAVRQVQEVLDRVDRAKEDWKKSGLS